MSSDTHPLGFVGYIDTEHLQFAMQGGSVHADELGCTADIAA
jgi:hypothetical protein